MFYVYSRELLVVYIVKLEEKKEGKEILFDDIKADIVANRLAYKQQQTILTHLDELKSKAKIDINKELLTRGKDNESGK